MTCVTLTRTTFHFSGKNTLLMVCFDSFYFAVNCWDISRNHEDFPALLQKRGDKCLGHSKEPLIHVPFDRVVVDTLHLFLRIMGKLLNQVLF